MSDVHPYYLVWTGSLNFGDTPGVFNDAQFVGLMAQIPITITFIPEGVDSIELLLMTTEVEVFEEKRHPVFWDWNAGDALPQPVGYIDDRDLIPGRPEYHVLTIPSDLASIGKHWITILVNADVQAGLRDDFVLRRIEAGENIGVKIGW
jgi:hypothetical protein